jgi:hypothetical protein
MGSPHRIGKILAGVTRQELKYSRVSVEKITEMVESRRQRVHFE